MLERPLRVGVSGAGAIAHGVALQVESTDGMELAWRCPNDLEKLTELLKTQTIDVFVEAYQDLDLAAQASQLAIDHNAHIVLTNPRVEAITGLTLQAKAYQNGIIVTSDAGTPHGNLASLIQEAHIMGFQTVQAGQICSLTPSAQLPYEMAALANGFGFLPPKGGMTGPEVNQHDDILTAFDLDSYGETTRVDFVRSSTLSPSLYLILRAKKSLTEEQTLHLKECQLGEGPYFLLTRNFPLGYFETPKAILGASAGQPILSPGYPTCEVYAQLAGRKATPTLLPYSEDLIPSLLLPKEDTPDSPLTLENVTLPDSPLTHLWIEQREIIETQQSS